MRTKARERGTGKSRPASLTLKKSLPPQELGFFCTEMGMMLQSGMTIFDGVAARAAMEYTPLLHTEKTGGKKKKDKHPRSLFTALHRDMQQGLSLSESMEAAGNFPPEFTGMIRIGEESGSLEEVMKALALHYQRDGEVSAQIRSAMTYPILTLCMMAVILGVLTREVFPVFTRIYESLGSGLSDAAQASIALGSACADVIAVLAVGLLIIAAGVWLLGRFAAGERLLARIKGFLPFFRRVSRRLSSARAADSLAMMLQAGYDTEESLEKIAATLSDPRAARQLRIARERLSAGAPLGTALAESGLWNGTECRMIQSGVKFGSLDTILKFIADTGMDQAEEDVAKAVSLIEPIMIAVTAILIGSILLAVILPLSGIMAAIG